MDDSTTSKKNRQRELEELILSLFSSLDELGRFVDHELDKDIRTAVAWERPVADVAHDLVMRLEARGLIDVDLFEALFRARKQRSADIERVRHLWAVGSHLSGHGNASNGSPSRKNTDARTWIVGGVLLVLSALVFVHDPEHLHSHKLEMTRHLVALGVGIGVAFIGGRLTVRWNSGGWLVQASSGVAAWVIALMIWRASPVVSKNESAEQANGAPVTSGRGRVDSTTEESPFSTTSTGTEEQPADAPAMQAENPQTNRTGATFPSTMAVEPPSTTHKPERAAKKVQMRRQSASLKADQIAGDLADQNQRVNGDVLEEMSVELKQKAGSDAKQSQEVGY